MSVAGSSDLNALLTDFHSVAVVATQPLRPAQGKGTPFFPPTYLGADNGPTYCISTMLGGRNLCVVDSVQSQANRIEEAFLAPPYRELVRRVTVTAKLPNDETRTLDMLQLGHRLADAAVAFSDLADQANAAMRSFVQGPQEIAALSPMSLLMGLWESRGEGTQLKIPRAFSAEITAADVSELRRMATFTGSFWSKDLGLAEKHSQEGLDPVPAGEALGGVVAAGDIVRTATLNLVALRQNCKVAQADPPSDAARYVFGLGLVALSMQPETFLRQGCLLVADGPMRLRVVTRTGAEQEVEVAPEAALAFAQDAAQRFGVPDLAPIEATFSTAKLEKPAAGKEKAARRK